MIPIRISRISIVYAFAFLIAAFSAEAQSYGAGGGGSGGSGCTISGGTEYNPIAVNAAGNGCTPDTAILMNGGVIEGTGALTLEGSNGTSAHILLVKSESSTLEISGLPTIDPSVPNGVWQAQNGLLCESGQFCEGVSGLANTGSIVFASANSSGLITGWNYANGPTFTGNFTYTDPGIVEITSNTSASAELIIDGPATGDAGFVALESAATGSYGLVVATFPGNTGTVGELNLAQSWTANQTFSDSILNPGITADTGKTDATVCEDITAHQFWSGTGTAGICLGTVSSIRFKRDWAPLDPRAALDMVMGLIPGTWRYKAGVADSGARRQIGFLAENYARVMPEWTRYDSKGRPNGDDILAVVMPLVAAVQEQQREIEKLRAEIQNDK